MQDNAFLAVSDMLISLSNFHYYNFELLPQLVADIRNFRTISQYIIFTLNNIFLSLSCLSVCGSKSLNLATRAW